MLSDMQKSSARFDGGKPLANYRSHLRRTRSTLWSVRAGTHSQTDSAILEQACVVLDRQLAEIETELTEAKRIKRDWDQRKSVALKALSMLPSASVADVIALADLDHQIGAPHLLTGAVQTYGWAYMSTQLRRDAIDGLAYRCACDGAPVDQCVETLRAAMPAAAAMRAALIETINTLAVAEQMQRASQPDPTERRP